MYGTAASKRQENYYGDSYPNRQYNRNQGYNHNSGGYNRNSGGSAGYEDTMYAEYEAGEPDGCAKCLEYLLIIFNVVFMLGGIGVCAGSIYILVDHTFVSDVIGNVLLTVSCWLVIIGAGITIFISIIGCCGAAKNNRCMLFTYCGILGGIALVLVGGGIIALTLKGEIGEWVIVEMEETLKDEYGINQQDKYNQIITQAWDQGQEKMYCCAVRDLSWGVYRQSLWYADQPGIENFFLNFYMRNDSAVDKPYVPKSCCKQDVDGNYLEVKKCQTFYQGPPGVQSGSYNEALLYRGCYTAGKEWIDYYSSWLAGLGIGLGAILGLGIFSSVWLAIRLKKRRY